ncbi:DUF6461 domain-containing protein [Herbidospora sp. RD11066]
MSPDNLLASYQWLCVPETKGGGRLGSIFAVAWFRGLTPRELALRISRGTDPGHESGFAGLDEKASEPRPWPDSGGSHVGIVQSGEWSVAIEPGGWTVEADQSLSEGCEMVAVNRHDYAEHHFTYAINGLVVTTYILHSPYKRHGTDPDRLNAQMRELGMGLAKPTTDAAWDEAWDANYPTAIPRGFALAAKVTGVPFTPGLLDAPMLVAPIVNR